jgi:import inner membrane translocase subunit TIM54
MAERIRDYRRRQGEVGGESTEEEKDIIIREVRERLGVTPEPTIQGDIVIGRHTWKEYIRGLHEGWLGPLETPPELIAADDKADISAPAEKPTESAIEKPVESSGGGEPNSTESPLSDLMDITKPDENPENPENSKQDDKVEDQNPERKEEPPKSETKKRKLLPPFINTDSYSSVSLPPTFNSDLGPSVPVTFPHILGFLNTPIRMYRFLTRRYMAEEVGKQVAAAVLASYEPYKQVEKEVIEPDSQSPSESQPISRLVWEQEIPLEKEESDWHKSVRKRGETDIKQERVWLDPIIMDDRIASRMKKFVIVDDYTTWKDKDP